MSEASERNEAGPSSFAFGFLCMVMLPLILLSDTLVAVFDGWRPKLWLEDAGVVVFAAWFLLCLILLFVRSGRNFYRARAAELFVLHAIVVIFLLLGQGLLVLLDPQPEILFHHRIANQQRIFDTDPQYIRGVTGPSRYTINTQGIRGPELEEHHQTRILCVGGSTTECMYVDDEKYWPGLVARQLDPQFPNGTLWLGSVGVSGYSSFQHLQYARENEHFGLYDQVIFLVGANDLLVWLAYVPRTREPFWTRSAYFGIGQLVLTVFWPAADPLVEDPKGAIYKKRRHDRQSGTIITESPPAGIALQHYEERLVALVNVCRERGVEPILCTQPTLWVKEGEQVADEELWMGRYRQSGDYLHVYKLRALLDQFNARVRKVCREEQVSLVDLAEMNENPEYFFDDMHFTEAGSREVAKRVTQVLQASTD